MKPQSHIDLLETAAWNAVRAYNAKAANLADSIEILRLVLVVIGEEGHYNMLAANFQLPLASQTFCHLSSHSK
jgi:hypothetical protein